jgi:CheY-like chemotaxis protein
MLKEQQKEHFHQCLRSVDTSLKMGHYEEAKQKLAEAKEIDPKNPYIIAFEERIRVFETKFTQPGTDGHTVKKTAPPPYSPTKTQPAQSAQQIVDVEKNLHEEVKRTDIASEKILQEEREKLKRQQEILQQRYEQQLHEMQRKMEDTYRRKLAEETASAEERLKQQFEAEQAYFEKEVMARLQDNYQQKVQELEQQLQANQTSLLERERTAFAERERKMKEEFNKKLLEGIRKTESVLQEQTLQQQEEEKAKLKEQITQEYEKRIFDEREKLTRQYDDEKSKLQQTFLGEQNRLREDFQRQLSHELELAKQKEAQKLEEKRIAAIRRLEQESQQKYQEQLDTERKRMEGELSRAIEEERLRLQTEYEMLMSKQKKDIQKVKTELEEQFTKRLETVVLDYDHRMKLLGITPPKTKDEAAQFYMNKMQLAYSNGQPSVDSVRELMELKEILELTYDEHVQIETDVRLKLYVDNVERGILSGMIKPMDTSALDELKQKYSITMEEASKLEHYILESFQRVMLKGRILLADDDADIRSTLADILSATGFQVVVCESVNEALEKLKTISVDLIVSDIKFIPGEPDGFKFFTAVQAQPNLSNIPFILLSSLTDGIIIRSGVQLGVDDYLTKPVDPELLIATIEGKLKRHRRVGKK